MAEQGLWIPNPACLAGHVPGSPAHSPAQDQQVISPESQGAVIKAVPGCCRRESPESLDSGSSLCRSEAGRERNGGQGVGCFFPTCLAAGGALELSFTSQALAPSRLQGLTPVGTHEVCSSETPPRPVNLVKFKELGDPQAKVTWNLFCQKFTL